MQNPQPAPQPQITYVYTAPPNTGMRPGYAGKTSRALGITQVIMGILLFVFQVLSIIYYSALMFVGHGIWTGIIVIIAGAFGIAAASHKSTCLIVTFMVMSIIAAVFSSIPLSLSATALTMDLGGGNYWYYKDTKDTAIAMDALMLVVSIIEGIAAIWSAVICCKAMCCGTQSNNMAQGQVVQYVQAPGAAGAQPMSIVIAGPSGVVPQQGVQPTYMYAAAQAPQQYSVPPGQHVAMKGQQGGDSPPPAYSTDNPMEQKSMPIPN